MAKDTLKTYACVGSDATAVRKRSLKKKVLGSLLVVVTIVLSRAGMVSVTTSSNTHLISEPLAAAVGSSEQSSKARARISG